MTSAVEEASFMPWGRLGGDVLVATNAERVNVSPLAQISTDAQLGMSDNQFIVFYFVLFCSISAMEATAASSAGLSVRRAIAFPPVEPELIRLGDE
jgi:hypothetical protein